MTARVMAPNRHVTRHSSCAWHKADAVSNLRRMSEDYRRRAKQIGREVPLGQKPWRAGTTRSASANRFVVTDGCCDQRMGRR